LAVRLLRLSPWDRRAVLVVFLSALVLGTPGAFFGLPWGKSIEGASRILAGEIPYREFWTIYAPGHFYAIAGIFWLFGKEVLAQALATVVVRAASTAAFCVLLVRVGASRPVTVVLCGVFIGMFWTTAPELSSYDLALPLLLIAIERVVVYYRTGEGWQLGAAGLWMGLAAFFKHDVAAYVAAGAAASLFLSWILAGTRRPAAWLTATRAATRLVGVTIPVVAVMGAWIARLAGKDAWEDLVVFPATIFRDVRGEPYPPFLPPLQPALAWLHDRSSLGAGFRAFEELSQWIICYVPQYLFLATLAVLIWRRRQMEARTLAIVTICLASMPWFWVAAHVQRNTHPYSMAIFSFVVGSLAWQGAGHLGRRLSPARATLVAVLSVYAAALWVQPSISLFVLLREWRGSRPLDLEGVRGIHLRPREFEVYEPLGRLIRERTQSDERIYHGVLRHESIVVNNPIMYAVAGRRSCCRYSELHPGVTDRASVQEEIIEDIEKHDVRAVIIWKFGWSDEVLDKIRDTNRAAVEDGGSTKLNEYIASRFESIAEFGQYDLMWRKNRHIEAESLASP